MVARINEKFRIQNAIQFRNAFAENNIYMFLGKETAWEASSSTNPPETPNDTQQEEYSHWMDMIGSKRVGYSSTTHVIPRFNWATGSVYIEYDDVLIDLISTEFYVLTDDLNVYKCISNNSGAASTKKPSGTGTGYISHDPSSEDGYIWKYMYTVQEIEAERFLSENWIPVQTISAGASTCEENALQYDVQQAAVPGSLSMINVISGGTGYGAAPTVTVVGDGSDATATAIVSGGAVVRVTLTNRGIGYTWAEVEFSTGAASARAITSPVGGHGNDAIKELGGKYVLVRSKIRFDELNFPVENDYRKIGLVMDPRVKAIAPALFATGSLAAGSTYDQTVGILLTASSITGNGGEFDLDETVTQSGTGATGSVVEQKIDASTSKITLKLNNVVGVFDDTGNLGAPSGAAVTYSNIEDVNGYDLERGVGDVIYIDHREPINRAPDSSEDIRVIIEF